MGTAAGAHGYFCVTSGAMTKEAMTKEAIEEYLKHHFERSNDDNFEIE